MQLFLETPFFFSFHLSTEAKNGFKRLDTEASEGGALGL